VTVSRAAAGFARERGGRIYVWAEPAGASAYWLHASAYDPGGRRYASRRVGDIEVLVAHEVALLDLKVRLSFWRRSLVAEWPTGGAAAGGGAA
jgi:hypothetical protein